MQNEFQELRNIWAQWDDEAKQLFYQNYGDLPYLLGVKVDRHLFRAMVQFWNPAYSCFTFGDVDLAPTLEEYTTLLHCPRIQGHKAYVRPASLPTFAKKLVMITGMSDQWAVARIQQKGDSKYVPWAVLRDLILTHPDVKKRVDVLALSIYGMVIFPKALGHIDEAVVDLFDRVGKQNTPVLVILAETFRSLSACRRAGEDGGREGEKGKEKDRDDLKTHYKKAQVTLKRVRLGRSPEQWQQEIQEERAKAEYWEKKFQEMQSRNQALEKENQGLKTKHYRAVSYELSSSRQEKNSGRENFTIFRIKLEIGIISWEKPEFRFERLLNTCRIWQYKLER
ncbi:hypothetical protein PVK06_005498 [Gossypium arboreum]|uniref:DUF7745 domain-containing protein n=1 Tax=Gossypium arboreum TaxID=29729 RepID=A0ABR0QW10_GOSAR|nr:hypothetical protein PVK06_005498 [Gossypium arboreum]